MVMCRLQCEPTSFFCDTYHIWNKDSKGDFKSCTKDCEVSVEMTILVAVARVPLVV